MAVAAAAAVAVGDEERAFNGSGSVRRQRRWGLQIGNDEETMEIDISGGGWRWQASAFDSGDGRRWALAFGGGDGQQLWQRWIIEIVFNDGGDSGVRWRQQRLTNFFMASAMDDCKGIVRQRWWAQREDKRETQEEATQQPAIMMRGRESGATRGQPTKNDAPTSWRDKMTRGLTTRQRDVERVARRGATRDDKRTSGRPNERTRRGKGTTSWRNERTRG